MRNSGKNDRGQMLLATGIVLMMSLLSMAIFGVKMAGISMPHDTAGDDSIQASGDIAEDDMVLDIGPDSAHHLAEIIKNAKTILWNGPVGVFEIEQFGKGTEIVSKAIADSEGFSIAGGGDTLAAIDKYGIKEQVSYISTGGGAFLEFVEGKKLPAVEMLEQRANG